MASRRAPVRDPAVEFAFAGGAAFYAPAYKGPPLTTFNGYETVASMYHSTDWTLLLKKHKTTILLSVQPDNTTLSAVKEKLFHCLVSRGINEINNDPVPLDVNGIDLGIPIDQNEPEKGWISLERKATGDDDKSEMPNGKPRQLSDTILSAGLSDRNILAFRFRQPGETSSEAHETELDHADPGWDVILPSFDDEDEELPL